MKVGLYSSSEKSYGLWGKIIGYNGAGSAGLLAEAYNHGVRNFLRRNFRKEESALG